MKDEPVVMFDSDDAAQYKTGLSGWVSRRGHYFGEDERMARYDGCTHSRCECGNLMNRSYTKCAACADRSKLDKYMAMPEQEWDGLAMIYSEARDEYYPDPDEAEDVLDDGQTLRDLRLIVCVPVYAHPIESDYYCDETPEDGDLPLEVEDAMRAYNEAIKGVILSWYPGKYRLELEADDG